jgi:transcriptional regulator with XRE-family HTH domain
MREYLVELRTAKNLTQLDMSKKLSISESYYSLIENGERQKDMSITFLSKLSEALGVSKNSLLRMETEYAHKE